MQNVPVRPSLEKAVQATEFFDIFSFPFIIILSSQHRYVTIFLYDKNHKAAGLFNIDTLFHFNSRPPRRDAGFLPF